LSLSVKYPPLPDSIRIAVEAGHGGSWNWGAVGLSGLKEKDINLDTSERLIEMLREMGYKVVEIRHGDADIKLRDRWKTTEEIDADLFVSIHANAAGGNYLRVAGTSTYYNNPFWRSFAELTYDKLLELDLEEFGVIGSFNYMMCRMSNRPSILVEQAFMSHAEDENKLADPEFRQSIAERIAVSIDQYVEEKLAR
jgi:N-acetylmuramoyl-L-alanine amidase